MVSQKTGDIRYCWQKMVAVVLMKLMVCWVARRKDTDKIIGVVFIVQQQLRGNKEHTLNGTCLSMAWLFAVEFRCLLVVCRHGNVVSELRKRTANCSWKIKRIVRWLTVDGTEIGKRERDGLLQLANETEGQTCGKGQGVDWSEKGHCLGEKCIRRVWLWATATVTY